MAQQLQTVQDPLMEHPLTKVGSEPVVDLMAHDRPKLTCSVESTPYGYALSGAGHFVTLAPQSGPILQALNGCSTLTQIREQFGEAGLQLVASLYQKRLVKWEQLCGENRDLIPFGQEQQP